MKYIILHVHVHVHGIGSVLVHMYIYVAYMYMYMYVTCPSPSVQCQGLSACFLNDNVIFGEIKLCSHEQSSNTRTLLNDLSILQ